jgi:hypothetical protein
MNQFKWTEPYCDVSHYGYGPNKRWATITIWGTFTVLTLWTPGVGLEAPEYTFYGEAHEQSARNHGEWWTTKAVMPIESATIIQSR